MGAMTNFVLPGVYRQEVHTPAPRPFATGVAAFLGYAPRGPETVTPISSWAQFVSTFSAMGEGFLAPAVRGFFENGGQQCMVVRLRKDVPAQEATAGALAALEVVPEADLVCVPDAGKEAGNLLAIQQEVVNWCDRGGERFALLDSRSPMVGGATSPENGNELSASVEQFQDLDGINAAIFYPWLVVTDPATPNQQRSVPPCGHLAGVYARNDRENGVFAAPANLELLEVNDVTDALDDMRQTAGDPHGVVNCLRVFPGRGIRVWGARTISGVPAWRQVNVRRLFLTLHRWLATEMSSLVYEPNTPALWARLRRSVSSFLENIHARGGLAGATPAQAFFVRCDSSTTPPAVRDNGQVVAEIGLAPVVPAEFLVVKLIFGAGDFVLGDATVSPEGEV